MKELIFLICLALAILLFGASAFFITKLPNDIISADNSTISQSILASICASFIFLLVINSTTYIRDTLDRRSFRAFFGDLSSSKNACFVYPDFVLSENVLSRIEDLSDTEIYRKRSDRYSGSRFIDVPQIVASNDLQGIVIVASRIGKYVRDSLPLVTDGQAIDDPTLSFFSFGLTSNSVTELYLTTDPAPLFKIEDPSGNPKIVCEVDGKPRLFGRDEQKQHGIILRYRPNPQDYPQKIWIICAGLAAAGTPAAAWNLVHKWKKYHRRFGKKDFLIVFETSNDVYSYIKSTEVIAISR